MGAKNTLLQHTLQINASLFYIDWNNIQQNVYLPGCGEQFTANLGKAKSTGGDIEVPNWAERSPYLRLDYQHQTAQHSLLSGQDPKNALFDATLPGLPVVNNLDARAGLRFSGFDLSVYGNNLTNAHPLMFESRDIADSATDLLYFGRSVRPRTIGLTALYHY